MGTTKPVDIAAIEHIIQMNVPPIASIILPVDVWQEIVMAVPQGAWMVGSEPVTGRMINRWNSISVVVAKHLTGYIILKDINHNVVGVIALEDVHETET